MNTQDNDTDIIIPHNAPLTTVRKPQLGDTRDFGTTDATDSINAIPKGLSAGESAIDSGGLGQFSGGASPATSSLPEKNISVPSGAPELASTGTPAPVPGEGVAWTDGVVTAYLLQHNDNAKSFMGFHTLESAHEWLLDTPHQLMAAPWHWVDPSAPVVVNGVTWHPVQVEDGMAFLDEPASLPGRDDVVGGTYTGGM